MSVIYGEAQQLTPNVRRIVAPNPGPMTGTGTNSYLIGEREIALVDPGPEDERHLAALLRAVGDRLRWILVTHTHRDHSTLAARLARETGAELLGNTLIQDDGFQDQGFIPARQLAHDECLATAEFSLRVVKTPGHVGNHLCYFVEQDGLLLTGDHIMQGSTVVIIPPYGDMQDYIESLRTMQRYPLRYLGPGHGERIDNPSQEIELLIRHRLLRETKVLAKLQGLAPCDIASLLPSVYDDVDASLLPIAQYSLLAHLIKLEKEGRVSQREDMWRRLS